MSYAYAMGREPGPGELCTVEAIRASHVAHLDEMSQSHSPVYRAEAAIGREAMLLTDEELAEQRTAAGQEEERIRDALREARGNPELYDQLRSQLTRTQYRVSALQYDWSRRERERTNPESCARRLAERQEIETMWTTGKWRDYHVYTRWLDRSFWRHSPLRGYLASAHCALLGPVPVDDVGSRRCVGNANRLESAVITALPFAFGYYAYRKKDGSIPWTAGAAAFGIALPPLIFWSWFLYAIARYGAPQY